MPSGDIQALERSERSAASIEDAERRLRAFLVGGISRGELTSAFWAGFRKVIGNRMAPAAVASTVTGVTLYLDAGFLLEVDPAVLNFVLSHELMHVVMLHATRGIEFCKENNVSVSFAQTALVPYSDLPVNHALMDMPGYATEKDHILTYERVGLDYDKYPTLEAIWRFILDNVPPQLSQQGEGEGEDEGEGGGEKNQRGGNQRGQQGGQGGGCKLRIIATGADGSEQVIRDDGPGSTEVSIGHFDPTSQSNNDEEVKDALRASMKYAGHAPANMLKIIKQYIDENHEKVLSGWKMIEHYLVGERALDKGREPCYVRLNRRTRMVPGYKHVDGFRAMVILDESGSMDDGDVEYGFALAKKVILKDTSDCLYLIHYDTEPCSEFEEIRHESDLANLARKKCGGTVFTEMFSNDIVLDKDVDLYIVITDGYVAGWPKNMPPGPVIWIITSFGGYEQWQSQCGEGLAACVELQEK